MYVIGLTGGIGSGKSLVSDLFAQHGIEIIDTDVIAREVVTPGSAALKEIEHYFGAHVMNSQHELNRAALRKEIFSDPQKKQWLENLLHPLIYQAAEKKIKKVKSPYCIIVIPLLFETKRHEIIDRILVVESALELQIARVMTRDHSSKAEVEKIIAAQANAEIRRKGADDIIENNGSLAEVEIQVDQLHTLYLQFSASKKSCIPR